MALFPTEDWLLTLEEKLNSDEQYARIAQNWEGDMIFQVKADGPLEQPITYYLDLWHGKCRGVSIIDDFDGRTAAITMSAPYLNVKKIIKGETDVMQALLTRKISVKGNMALVMRQVPTVLDFVRCCREITDSYI